MALKFEVAGDVLRIDQTRRPLKIAMWVFYLGAISGYVQLVVQYTQGKVPVAPLVAAPVGIVLLALLMGAFLVESHVVVDREARTIAMRGYRWPVKRWNVARSLADVAGVEMAERYVGKGQYDRRIVVRFTDDTSYLACSPAASMVATIEERLATLRDFTRADPPYTSR